jgi:lysophospholipase L1-like esterase
VASGRYSSPAALLAFALAFAAFAPGVAHGAGPSTSTSSTIPAATPSAAGAVTSAVNRDDPQAISFDEFGLGSTITDDYASRGVVFTSDVFLTSDGANPTSPVLSGTPRFFGTIAGRFTVPGTTTPTTVNGFSLDVGFINNRNSVEVDYFDASGKLVGSTRAQQNGINELNIAYRGVASFTVSAIEAEIAGFAIDNLIVRTTATGIKPTRMAELGDSYSSGEGLIPEDGLEYDCGTDLHKGRYHEGTTHLNGPFSWGKHDCQTATGSKKNPRDFDKRDVVTYENLCHRHGRAYPNQLRERFGIAPANSIFVACSGATTANVGVPGVGVAEAQYPQSPAGVHGGQTQFQNLSDFALGGMPDLITIGIGGNDAGFVNIIKACIFGTCTDPDVSSRILATINGSTYNKVRLTLAGLRSFAIPPALPIATVVVFGYPSIIDDPAQACIPRIGPDEMAWLKNVVLPALNDTIKDAATAAGVAYADITQATVGHGVCSGDGRWINPGRWGDDEFVIGNESMHPNQSAHDAIAQFFIDHYTDGAGRLLLTNPPPGNPIRPQPGAGIILGNLSAGAVQKCGAACLQPAACIQTCNVNLQGAGFAPGVTMGAMLQSDPVYLGQVVTDASGHFEAGYKLPKGIEPGEHTITLDGLAADGTRQFAVQGFRVFGRIGARIKAKFIADKGGFRVRALVVKRLLPGARIDIACAKGSEAVAKALAGGHVRRAAGCPFAHRGFKAPKAKGGKGKGKGSRDLSRLFRSVLAPGAVIRVMITQQGESGRALDAIVRARKGPKLIRRCTDPGQQLPTAC